MGRDVPTGCKDHSRRLRKPFRFGQFPLGIGSLQGDELTPGLQEKGGDPNQVGKFEGGPGDERVETAGQALPARQNLDPFLEDPDPCEAQGPDEMG